MVTGGDAIHVLLSSLCAIAWLNYFINSVFPPELLFFVLLGIHRFFMTKVHYKQRKKASEFAGERPGYLRDLFTTTNSIQLNCMEEIFEEKVQCTRWYHISLAIFPQSMCVSVTLSGSIFVCESACMYSARASACAVIPDSCLQNPQDFHVWTFTAHTRKQMVYSRSLNVYVLSEIGRLRVGLEGNISQSSEITVELNFIFHYTYGPKLISAKGIFCTVTHKGNTQIIIPVQKYISSTKIKFRSKNNFSG